jgi:GAF domain-containing protein
MSIALRRERLAPESRSQLDDILREAAALAGVPVAAIWSTDDTTRTLTVMGVAGPEAGSLPLATLGFGIGGIGWVASNRTALIVPDVFGDPRFVGLDWRRSHGLTSFFGVPLVHEDRVLGVLALDGRAPIELTELQSTRLAELAARASVVLVEADRAAEAEHWHQALLASQAQLATRVREMAALIAVADVVGATTDPAEALRRICRELGRLTGADTVAAYRLDPERREVYPVAGYHIPPAARAAREGSRLSLSEVSFEATLFEERQVVWSDDAPADPRFANGFFARLPHRSCALIPVVVDDEVSGVLHLVWWTASRRFQGHEIALLRAIGQQASTVLRNARLLSLRAVNRLANAAAHEFNNPLSVIMGHLQLLAPRTQGRERDRLDRALAAADRIADIVRRLTSITRISDLPGSAAMPPILDLRRSSEADAAKDPEA